MSAPAEVRLALLGDHTNADARLGQLLAERGLVTPVRRFGLVAPAAVEELREPVDLAVLVVAADVGVTRPVRVLAHLLRWHRVPDVAVLLSRIDLVGGDAEWLALLEVECRQALQAAGYPGDEALVLAANLHAPDAPATRAALDRLLDWLGGAPLPARPSPRLRAEVLRTEETQVWSGRWRLHLRVHAGEVRVGDRVSLFGPWQGRGERNDLRRDLGDRQGLPPWHARVQEIDRGRRPCAETGRAAELLVRFPSRVWLDTLPLALRSRQDVSVPLEAIVRLDGLLLGARDHDRPGLSLHVRAHGTITPAWLTLTDDPRHSRLEPALARLEIERPTGLEPGEPFTLFEQPETNPRQVGHGIVIAAGP
jgi:hypothetical protein